MNTVFFLFQSLRPIQWIKNGFILIPLVFSQRVFYYQSLLQALATVAVFCLLAGAIYLINDLFDLESDRRHPVKKNRPLAAGLISPRLAKATATVLLFLSLFWSAYLESKLVLVLVIYIINQVLYNYHLKEIVILDVFSISAGFFLRVVAGGVAIDVDISHWLIICTILISMFLALAKRRHELLLLSQTEAVNHRKILLEYTPYLLDQMIGIITAGTLLSYLLYCVSPITIEKFGTDNLIYTFPFVLYGIFRYLYLIHKKKKGGAPERILISDLYLLAAVILWGLSCILIIY